ncbi:MAG: hypothetical protein KAX05_15585 [Bacteroidales bacterium]|nr:hypothetical protein [Bacteroidales bacterium]
MNCILQNINYELIVAIVAFAVGLISLIVARKSIRKQTTSLIQSQLSEKANQCNQYLNPMNLSNIPNEIDKVSGILSSIITAEEILFLQTHFKKNRLNWKPKLEPIVDVFYLQLHTTIRVFFKNDNLENSKLSEVMKNSILQTQFQRCKEFLNKSITKSRNREFEKLHDFHKRI